MYDNAFTSFFSEINDNLADLAKTIFKETIPSSEYIPLSELVDVKDGTHDSPKQQNSGYPLVTSKAIKGTSINFSDLKLISQQDFNKINERSLVEHGDILFSMIGTVGLVYYVIDDPIKYAIKNIGLIKTHNSNYSNLIYLSLISYSGMSYIKTHISGSTQQFLSLTNLRNFPIPKVSKEQLNLLNHQVAPIFSEMESVTHQTYLLNKLKNILLSKLLNYHLFAYLA
jgi:type I restriction enzyme S subunit